MCLCRRRRVNPLDFKLIKVVNNNSVEVKNPQTLQSVEYKCQIINNILRIKLIQTFRSQSAKEYSETQYFFPIDETLCLESFQAKYQDNIIKGFIKGKEEAIQEYSDNKQKGNIVSYAAIQKSSNSQQVEIKLGNLPPNQQIEITLEYTQQLTSIFNKYYVAQIPLQYADNETLAKQGSNVLTLDLFCTGKITYAETKGLPAEKTAIDNNSMKFNLSHAFLQNDITFELLFSYEGMFDPQVILGSANVFRGVEKQDNNQNQQISHSAMISFIPNFNEEITPELDDTVRAALMNGDDLLSDEFQQRVNQDLVDHLSASRSEYLFLIDRSGSMSGRPIQKAKEALCLFLRSLPSDSYFNVIGFGTNFYKAFPTSQKYSGETMELAILKINNFKASLGGTEIYKPLASIFEKEPRIPGYNKQIFLLTDGGVKKPDQVVSLIKKNNKFNRVHSVGFGNAADKFLIEQSSVAGKGISRIIDMNADLSEVIINILTSSISPTYDNFSLVYDQNIIDSTFPISTNFPCVFKDEVINIHLFFKPNIDVTTLTDEQKMIKLQYYDSQKNQQINKQIRLEAADCFTCNTELQNSVFKLGKFMYLNECLSSQSASEDNQKVQFLQEALDYQLLTEQTAIICMIQELNDEQQMMFQNLPHEKKYTNEQTSKRRNRKNDIGSSRERSRSPNSKIIQSCKHQSGCRCINQKAIPKKQCKKSTKESNTKLKKRADSKAKVDLSVKRKRSTSIIQHKKMNETTYDENTQNLNSKKQSSMDELLDARYNQLYEDDHFKIDRYDDDQVDLYHDDAYDDEENENSMDDLENEENQIDEKLEKKLQYNSRNNRLKFEKLQKVATQQKQQQKPQTGSDFEKIISLVDNMGRWRYDLNLVNTLATKSKSKLQALLSQFKNKDTFMTLFILCILELFYTSEKSKWILISKKAFTSIKKDYPNKQDLDTIKQTMVQLLRS